MTLETRDENQATKQLADDLAKFPEENPNPVLRAGADGAVLYANQAAASLPGLLSRRGNRLPPDMARAVAASFEARENRQAELSSGDRLFSFALMPVPGEAYVNLYGRDITEERRAQRETRDLAKFPEENPNPVLRAASDGIVLYANQAARTLAGLLAADGDRLAPDIASAVAQSFEAQENRHTELASADRLFSFALTPVPGEAYVNLYGRDITEERRAQREARDLAKFPEENPNPILRAGADGTVLYANQAATGLQGLLIEHGEHLAAGLADPVAAAFDARQNRQAEIVSADRLFIFALTPVPGETYVNLYGRDITEERRAQQLTRDLAKFPEENPNPVLRAEADGVVLYANEAARKLAGLLAADGGRLTTNIAAAVSESFETETNRRTEFVSGGRLFIFALTPVPGETYVNLYGRDITDERQASLEVIRVRNFNQNILDNLSNGILTFDSDRRLSSVNPVGRRIFGLGDDEWHGRTIDALLGGDNAWLLDAVTGNRFETGAGIWMDRELVGVTGERTSVNLTAVPLKDREAASDGLMLILEDITREKRFKGTMVRFMSDSVVEQLMDLDETVLGGATQEVTIVFSDIRGFTKLSESLGAQDMVAILNNYFSNMVDIIFEHGGTLDKFIGDAIMAVFGAPIVALHDTDNAVTAAVEMLKRLREFNVNQTAEGRPQINIGVGIDTGAVIAGTIGSPRRMDYTVIGEHVNLASRIESANKYYGTRILISEHTKAKLSEPRRIREVDLIRVQGIETPIRLFEVLDYHTEETFPGLAGALAAFAEGLQHYRDRQWSQGAAAFAEALAANPNDRPAQILLSRCWANQARPPVDSWTGVTDISK